MSGQPKNNGPAQNAPKDAAKLPKRGAADHTGVGPADQDGAMKKTVLGMAGEGKDDAGLAWAETSKLKGKDSTPEKKA